MKIYTKKELNEYLQSLTYDDISLIPTKVSRMKSRTETTTSSEFLNVKLNLPVISSPMDTVTGLEMTKELSRLGSLGILNRFDSSLDELINHQQENGLVKAVSIAINTPVDKIEKLVEHKYIICIDTANANNSAVLNKTEEIKNKFDVKVIVGNIAHGATLQQLENAGADAVRVGIGSGSVCTTSVQTGIGIGQVSSLLNVFYSKEKSKLKIKIIADGGIKHSGDVAKALALGADVVMVGRMFAGTKEAPGEVIRYQGQLWKKYRGSASFGVKMKHEFIEGEETMVAYKGAVKNVVDNIADGLRSTMSYMDCFTIDELRNVDTFAVLSNSSYLERLPRI